MRTRGAWARTLVVGLGLAALLGACESVDTGTPQVAVAGDAEQGAELIASHGCGGCHRIPGIEGADALVGPPLDDWGARTYIAGNLLNGEDNLVRWITNPQEVEPGTAMPGDLGVTRDEAIDMAAYLLSLGADEARAVASPQPIPGRTEQRFGETETPRSGS